MLSHVSVAGQSLSAAQEVVVVTLQVPSRQSLSSAHDCVIVTLQLPAVPSLEHGIKGTPLVDPALDEATAQ